MSNFSLAHKKVVIISAASIFILIAVVAVIVNFTQPAPSINNQAALSPGSSAAPTPTKAVNLRELMHQRQNPGQNPPALTAIPSDPLERRSVFAKTMNDRFLARGLKARVVATGDKNIIFRLSWPKGEADQLHIDKLKEAAPLHAELRSNGFEKIQIVVGEKTDWEKDL